LDKHPRPDRRVENASWPLGARPSRHPLRHWWRSEDLAQSAPASNII
jgi:hypothetical protein